MIHFRARVLLASIAMLPLVFDPAISPALAGQSEQQPAQWLPAEDVTKQRTDVVPAMDNGAAPATPKSDTLPEKALIAWVPFISWREAAFLKYGEKNILNPSWAAVYGMVWEYWGKDRRILEGTDQEAPAGFQVLSRRQSGKDWKIHDLKSSLARSIPVMVTLPLTPEAHPLYMTFEWMIVSGQVKNVELTDKGRPRSNALGRMVSLEDFRKIKEQMKGQMNPVMESMIMAVRLVIGYDDGKRMFIVHDPSFGPAFEIGYDDFERMWAAADGNYFVVSPDGYPQGWPKRPQSPAYRPRTPDEHAAMHFVYGYALDCIGRLSGGAKHFEQGLAIPGVSKGYQFLFQFELALNRGEQRDFAGAVKAAEKATEILPEHAAAWEFLSMGYMLYPEGGDRGKAKKAKQKAKALGEDKQARKVVAATIPADFFVQYLGPVRGWGGEATGN